MKFAIVTGASRGLGEGIAKKLIAENVSVITVSRTENLEIKRLAEANDLYYKHYACNLSLEKEVQEVFMEIAHRIFLKEPKEVLLFNNAGMIDPIHTVGNLDQTPMLRNIQVNLVAPMIITNIFLKNAQQTSSLIRVINITSGAAVRAIEGWSVYCSAKAGLNMFTQATALEQTSLGSPHQIIAFSPGVMDTKMQETIRESAEDAFKEVERFKEYKESGKLLSAAVVGSALVELVLHGDVESGRIYNVNELVK